MLTIPEVLDYLKISRGTLYKLFNEGSLQYARIAGCVRIPQASLLAFVARSTIK